MAKFFAIIPAAGLSQRMGCPKLSLSIGDKIILQIVIEVFRNSGIEKILIVLGPHGKALAPIAIDAGAEVHILDQPTPDMRATVEAGFDWIEKNWAPDRDDGCFLVPADHPTLSSRVIELLRVSWKPGSIAIPTHRDRRGHPALMSWSHISGIRKLDKTLGLNRYYREQEVIECACEFPEILFDLDTPEDYDQLLKIKKSPVESPEILNEIKT